MKIKTKAELAELVEYVKWYGGFKTGAESIAWLDENLPRWRLPRKTKKPIPSNKS